jgi:hypothetical protein
MAGLLDQRRIDGLLDAANTRVARKVDVVRMAMYRSGPNSAPPGMDNLDDPEKVRVFSRYLSRQSEREQRGAVAGNLSGTLVQHPAVREMAEQAGAMSPEEAMNEPA